ncbi:MAG TPA: TRAP transporter small permease [Desulfatiglandales bacterium]|nr:TRAP transporter small permease [Desulfatiglandales bacterium]
MKRIIRFCEGVLRYSAFTSIFIMMCLTTADAMGRYLLGVPVTGAYEITESYLMPVSFFFALCYAYRNESLIRVTFLVGRLRGYVQIILNHIVQVISISYGAILMVGTGRRAFRAIDDGTTLGNLDFPLWPAHMIVFVGLLALTLLMLVDIFRVRHGKGNLFQGDSSAA